jgi:8-hydroxy-5-deazaflavin:NADPH oxidoreductase
MRIAILGTGTVGQALATGWLRAGHAIIFGSRQPDDNKAAELMALFQGKVQIQATAAAIAAAEVVVLAVPWAAADAVIAQGEDWSGKILIDATNPIAPGLQLAVGKDNSGAEQVQSWAPAARVVKAFNTTGAENMLDPVYAGQAITMFIAGDDPTAKQVVKGLAEDIGFETADTGNLQTARFLEPLALAWIHLAIVQKQGRNIAFKVVKR